MSTIFWVALILAGLAVLGAIWSRSPAITAWIGRNARNSVVLLWALLMVLSTALGVVLSGGLNAVSAVDMVLSIVSLVLGGMSVVLTVRRMTESKAGLPNRPCVSRKRPTKAIKAQDDRHPPRFAEYLLYFLPKAMREPLLGDLEEEYHALYARFGRRKATFWYYAQVALSFWPLLSRGVRKLIKWGVVGWIGGMVRRLIS